MMLSTGSYPFLNIARRYIAGTGLRHCLIRLFHRDAINADASRVADCVMGSIAYAPPFSQSH